MQVGKEHYIPIISFLRAVASLGVCATHMHFATGLYHEPLTKFITYGQLGVAVFFTISGFIIPYSLWTSDYKLKNFSTYILKRSIRIDPPYLAVILICLMLGYQFDFKKFILHLFYLIPFSNYDWYQGTFWTLGIEFQFYIFIGLFFPFIKKGNLYFLIPILLAFSFTGYFLNLHNGYNFIFRHIHYFVFGIIALLYKKKRISVIMTQFLLMTLTIYLCVNVSILTGFIGFIASQFIINFNFQNKITNFLGKISYSLYLIHPLIGECVIRLLKPFSPNLYLLYFTTLISCILGASIFYYGIERISLKWSKSIPTNP
ncbi:acyltransferase [Pedobacter sp. PF22-3]|uniref:acyltransferase family protein n=1 Tax=Pedobacter sp. PF22-3 TaxID=2994467 RepID=UPI002246FB58|nr:acyltransferase [Pedobacter sp. PF22-3]MCX2492587.1 acyltransferase [Pedobacter sp. PF22-3]